MARLRPELLLRPLLPTQLLQTGFAFLSQAALFAYVSSFPSACTSSVMSGAPLEAGGVDSSAAAPSGGPKTGSSGGSKAAAVPSKHGGAVEAGIGRAWCRSYDLTKSMGEEMPARSGMVSGVRCNS